MPGTADDPVKLGPFKRLKEVHWPGNLAFRMTIKSGSTGGNGSICTPNIGIIPGGFAQVYTDTTFLQYDGAAPNKAWKRQGGAWVEFSAGDVDLEGMPPESGGQLTDTIATHGYLSAGQFDYPFIDPLDGAPLIDASVPVPDEAGTGLFDKGIGIEFQVLGNNMTGGTLCYLPPVGGPTAFDSRAYGGQVVLHVEPFDLTTVIARIDGKAYRPIATRLVLRTPTPDGQVDTYVLCKRSSADDTTA